MEIVLNNGVLEVKIESFGAELVGLKDLENNREYMWQKDPRFWAKCSPILFPFVGALKDDRYTYQGKEYQILTKHGFARDYEFELINKNETEAEFLFKSNEKTLEIYPFNFKLYLKYILDGKSLKFDYRVENLEDKGMYFSLGAHPAFSTPLSKDVDYSDYYIEFEKKESGEVNILNGTLINSQKKLKAFDGKIIKLTKDRFKDDALIIENPNSEKIYLKNDKTGYRLGFTFKGFKYIAFWNKVGAEYVCLEPWCGISDYDNTSGKIEEKAGIEYIGKNETFKRELVVEIF